MRKFMKAFLVLIASVAVYALYQYFKPVPGTRGLETVHITDAESLFSEFESDEPAANSKYLDKVIEVEGTVLEKSDGNAEDLSLIMDASSMIFGVSCSFEPDELEKLRKINPGDVVRIKGVCTGMLDDVVLNRCVILE